jgi:hypothetical protein
MLPRGRLAAGQDSPRDGGSPQAEIACHRSACACMSFCGWTIRGETALFHPRDARKRLDPLAGVRGLELANVGLIERRPNPLVCQNIFVPESFGEEPQRDGRGSHWGRARTRFPG